MKPTLMHRSHLTSFARLLARLTIGCLIAGQAFASEPVPGGIYQYHVPPGIAKVNYNDKPVLVYGQHALVGIPVKAKPGPSKLELVFTDNSKLEHEFEIKHKDYPEQHLTIKNKKMVNPDPENIARINKEARTMRAAYGAFNASQGDPKPFVQPVDGVITSPFGRRRVLNGQPRSPHSGLDIAGATGTPIIAPAPAQVAVTGDFYFNGNTVLLDHGEGLVSMYCHLSEIQVAKGDRIERGGQIGLVGATGRVTGPHLHWSVSLNGNRVDPATLMEILAADADPSTDNN